jgi:HEAT repeat protein
MPHTSVELLRSAVLVLGLSCLAVAVVVFFLMEIRYHNQLTREARRVMLGNLLIPSWDAETLRDVWRSGGGADQEILEEILVAHQEGLEPEEGGKFEQAVVGSGIYEHWLKQLSTGDVAHRVTAAISLGHFRDARGVQALVRAAEDPTPEVRLAVALSLGRLRDPGGLPGLIALSRQPGVLPEPTLSAALAACAAGCPERLVPLLEDREVRVRLIGAWALSEVANPSVLPQLRKAARDVDAEVRAKAARALGHVPDLASVEILVELARDPVWFVRVRALDALGKLRAREAEAVAQAGLGDNVREVRYRAAYALRQIAGMECGVALRVLRASPRRNFNSLLSEWERAGFLWQAAQDLSTHDWTRHIASREFLKELIGVGVTRALEDFVRTHPNLKVRLRLVRLLADARSGQVGEHLLSVAQQPECDRRVAAAIQARVGSPVPALTGEKGSARI